jgi:prepilin-type N-terminal cleavage/methylation domain-containing protein
MRSQVEVSMKPRRANESGFTLIEALIAIVVLAVGLIAVTNLLVVGAASNTIGNHTTNTTNIASMTLERLRNIPFQQLTMSPAGTIDLPLDSSTCSDTVPPPVPDCVRPGNFQLVKQVPGVGQVHTTWEIVPIDGQTIFIRVRAESTAALARRRARAEFTTIRSCTSQLLGCPI